MDDTQAAKVLRFTGKHKEVSEATPSTTAAPAATPAASSVRRPRPGVLLSLVALGLATAAVNRYAYRPSAAESSRAVASVNEHLERDAVWEKSLAERLAEPGAIQSRAAVGRRPNMSEELRFGLLEDRYVIDWRADAGGRLIGKIAHAAREPLAIDGATLVARFGTLFTPRFATARPTASADAANQTFDLVNGTGEVEARVTLAYDVDGRLISVSNSPVSASVPM